MQGFAESALAAAEEHVPYFLVSYVRGVDDAYVEEFFNDLRREVAALVGAGRPHEVGVLATDLDVGEEHWPTQTVSALAATQVFVPLCSPRLLLSESVGRQWWIFRERLRRLRDESGENAPSLLPLRWSAVRDLPSDFPSYFPADPADPRRTLRQYLRLRTLRPQYTSFLDRLANRIVKTARVHTLREYWPLPSPSRTPNAFTLADTGLDGPLLRGTRNVRFVVVAGSRDDMERVRDELEYYGKDSTEWAPYRPRHVQPLAMQAQAVAASQLFGSEVTDLKDLRRTLDLAEEANDLVVLLLDPWSTRIPDSRRRLSDADRAGLPEAAVLVPVNAADRESERSHEELMFDVEQTLAHFFGRPDALHSRRLPTPESFHSQLASTLEEGRNRMFRASGRRSLPPDSTRERPILHGP